MKQEVMVDASERNGNLHINLGGFFDSEAAVKVSSIIRQSYAGEGNIFIHTNDITDVTAQSRVWFGNLLNILGLPKQNIYLMGDRAMDICHDNGRVIVKKVKKETHTKCYNCKNCQCKDKKTED